MAVHAAASVLVRRQAEVARHAGYVVAVLLAIYTYCTDGQAVGRGATMYINDALTDPDARQESDDEGNDDSLKSQAKHLKPDRAADVTAPDFSVHATAAEFKDKQWSAASGRSLGPISDLTEMVDMDAACGHVHLTVV